MYPLYIYVYIYIVAMLVILRFMTLASQGSSSEVSGCGNKISTTILGSEIAGEDCLNTSLERQLSKDKVEALGMCFGTTFENLLGCIIM